MTANGAVRLSAAVMTHPARVRHAEELAAGHPELDLEVVVDPAPEQGRSAMRTARRAWGAVASDATHHLVLQDDAVLCPNFRELLDAAIAARPDRALCLHTESGSETSYAMRLAALVGSWWAEVADEYVPTIALVLPAELARGFSRLSSYPGPHDDFAMRAFLSTVGVAADITVPNLADHAGPNAGLASIAGHDFLGERPSACVWTEDMGRPAWSAEAVPPRAMPAFAWRIGKPYWLVRADRPGCRWREVPPDLTLRDHGLTPAELTALAHGAIGQWPAMVRVVGPRLLAGLWATAYGLGLVAAGMRGADPGRLDRALARPVTRRALATMASGALRFVLHDHQLAECRDELGRLVEHGVREGLERPEYVVPRMLGGGMP